MITAKRIVLDASAFLALLNQEPGYQIVEAVLADAVISTVNITEVLSVLANDVEVNITDKSTQYLITQLVKEVIPFDQEQAIVAATMKESTKTYGLSLGDRACLALAKTQKLPVLTADKIWLKLEVGIDIRMIR